MGAPTALAAPALHAAEAQQQQMALVGAVAPKGAPAAMGTRLRCAAVPAMRAVASRRVGPRTTQRCGVEQPSDPGAQHR